MLTRIFVLGSILPACLGAATIDAGVINAPGGTFAPLIANLASSGGHFSIDVVIQGGRVLPQTACQCWTGFPTGTMLALAGSNLTDAFRNTGSATVNGVFYPSLIFNSGSFPIATSLNIQVPAFPIDHAGSYAVPFSMTGRIQAALAEGPQPQYVINEGVTGAGTLEFSLTGGPGIYSFGPPMTFTFAAPEPNSLLLMIAGLLALAGGARRYC